MRSVRNNSLSLKIDVKKGWQGTLYSSLVCCSDTPMSHYTDIHTQTHTEYSDRLSPLLDTQIIWERCCSCYWESSCCTSLLWFSCLCQRLSAWVKLVLLFSFLYLHMLASRFINIYVYFISWRKSIFMHVKTIVYRNMSMPAPFFLLHLFICYWPYVIECCWHQVWTTGETGTSDLWYNCSTSNGGYSCNPASAGGQTPAFNIHLTGDLCIYKAVLNVRPFSLCGALKFEEGGGWTLENHLTKLVPCWRCGCVRDLVPSRAENVEMLFGSASW